jgi:LmbE family N-acetylglucosaminyl deacetylase
MPGTRVVLHVAPHPDDELLGAPAHLMALRDAGWRVVNVAVSLGRPGDRVRRRAEVGEACRRAGFELVVLDPPVVVGRGDGDAAAQADLGQRLAS